MSSVKIGVSVVRGPTLLSIERYCQENNIIFAEVLRVDGIQSTNGKAIAIVEGIVFNYTQKLVVFMQTHFPDKYPIRFTNSVVFNAMYTLL